MNPFIVADSLKCIGCRTCEVACVVAHQDEQACASVSREAFLPRIRVVKGGMFSTAVACHQCEDAPRSNVCPTGAMGLIEGAEFADDPEPPKRCLFALAECESCGRYYATNKEVAFANELLEQEEHADAARARALTSICPDCKRLHDAKAAARRSGMKRG